MLVHTYISFSKLTCDCIPYIYPIERVKIKGSQGTSDNTLGPSSTRVRGAANLRTTVPTLPASTPALTKIPPCSPMKQWMLWPLAGRCSSRNAQVTGYLSSASPNSPNWDEQTKTQEGPKTLIPTPTPPNVKSFEVGRFCLVRHNLGRLCIIMIKVVICNMC